MQKTYYEVCRIEGAREALSAEFLDPDEARGWASDLERRGFQTVIYKIDAPEAVLTNTDTKKVA